MSSRPSMELDDVPGKFPDFGAIFMSNNATRKECFRRNLLGLPIGQAHFVMQVKAGMILFLFEFEKRQLHGVFQACSDGALNIVPHAFSSSGKQFPAQVRVLPIWNCSPLHENEFRDAIRENYYSANKFKFGLSERQVRRLLSLFSVRKLKDEPSMREYIQNKVARPIAYSRNEVRSAVEDGRSGRVDRAKDQRNAGSIFGSEFLGDSISNHGREIDDGRRSGRIARNRAKDEQNGGGSFGSEFLGDPITNYGREVDDDRRSGCIARNRAKDERNAGSSFGSEFLGDSISNHGREIDDDRRSSCIARNRFEDERNAGSSFGSEFHGDSISNHGREIDDGRRSGRIARNRGNDERNASSTFGSEFLGDSISNYGREVDDDRRSGRIVRNRAKDERNAGCSFGFEFLRDSISNHGREIDDDRRSSHIARNKDEVEKHQFSYEHFINQLGQVGRSVYDDQIEVGDRDVIRNEGSMNVEPRPIGMTNFPGHYYSLTGRGHPDDLSYVTGYELGLECSEDNRFHPSILGENDGHFQPDPPLYSVKPVLEANSLIHDQSQQSPSLHQFMDPQSSGLSFSALYADTEPGAGNMASYPGHSLDTDRGGHLDASFQVSHELGSECKEDICFQPCEDPGLFQHNPSVYSINPTVEASSFALDKDPSPMMDYRYPLSSQQKDHSLVSSSKNLDIYKNSGTMYSQDKNRRVSVFSRIAMPLETHEQDEHKMVSSVDEVMDVLHQSRQQWLKSKSSKQLTAKRDEVSRMRSNNLMMFTSNPSKIAKGSKDQLQQISKQKDQLPQIPIELTDEDVLVDEANDASKAEEVAFRDFKRRSKVTKSKHNGYSGDHDASTVIIGSSGWQRRKRKLVRPKFNEPCDDHIVKSKDANTTDQDKSDRVTGSPGTDKDE